MILHEDNQKTISLFTKIFFYISLIYLTSCNNKTETSDTPLFKVYFNMEKYTVDKKTIFSNDSSINIKTEGVLTDEEAFSGKFSVKFSKAKKYGLIFKKYKFLPDKHYKISIMRKGSSTAQLVASSQNFWKSTKTPINEEKNGWEKLELIFYAPPLETPTEIPIFVYMPDSTTVFFDNFIIEQIPNANYPKYSKYNSLQIFIDNTEILKLKKIRKEAFKRKILVTTDSSFVKGIVFSGNEDYKANLRFKGDWLDHLQGEKWSFRIKLKKGKAWRGMKTFSIQSPKARSFMKEWVAHKLYEKEDILTTRYDFIPVYLNKKSLGYYAFEEHFEKQLVENKKRREGPIMKFSEDQLWESRIMKKEAFLPNFEASEIRAYKQSKISRNHLLFKEFLIARNLMYCYKENIYKASDVFDINKLAKYYAVTDLLRAYHGIIWHNRRFYYNPAISKLEPIAFDCYSDDEMMFARRRILTGFFKDRTKQINNFIFSDSLLRKLYIKELHRITKQKYLEDFFTEISEELQNKTSLLTKEFSTYTYNKNQIFDNAKKIRKELIGYEKLEKSDYYNPENFTNPISKLKKNIEYDNILPPFYIKAYTLNHNGTDKEIKIINYYPANIKIVGSGQKDNNKIKYFNKPIKLEPDETDYLEKTILVNEAHNCIYINAENGNDTIAVKINEFNAPEPFLPAKEFLEKYSIKNNSELYTITNHEVIFNTGFHRIQKAIVIPAGYSVKISAGTELDFINNSCFMSYSPIFIKGDINSNVIIKSSDNTCKGFTVLQTNKKSIIDYAVFEGLNTFSYKGWCLSGSVNFYESDITIKNTIITKNVCEDALNIIRSNFYVDNCKFEYNFSDAFDSDFSKGSLTNTIFNNPGNDAIDFSGSTVNIENCKIISAGDKGISAGEGSNLTVKNCEIYDSFIGAASKDKSNLILKSISIKNCKYGLTAYCKKSEYGSSKINVEDIEFLNIDNSLYIEKNSVLIFNNQTIKGDNKNIYENLYLK